MSNRRFFFIQQQYIFIHDCVKEMLEDKRRREMERDIYVNQGFGKCLEQSILNILKMSLLKV